jgi:dihydroflavonol-4-reductase
MRSVLGAAAAVGVDQLVYTSSATTVGRPSNPNRMADETDYYCPGSTPNPYYEVKWAMELEAMRATAQGMPVICVLPTAVFGPGDVKPATGKVLTMVSEGRVPGYVQGVLNVVDVRDVAEGHIAAADRGRPGQRYILGGHNLTIHEFLIIASESAGRSPPRYRVPHWLVRVGAALGGLAGLPGTAHLSAVDHWQPLDTTRAHRDLGIPTPIPFDKTCRDALAWFHDHGYLNHVRSEPPE